MSSEPRGMIFSLQRMAVHDGPGWRTLVFLKGCPLKCRWCCNPESWNHEPVLAFNPERCIGTRECGYCIEACPQQAILSLKKDSTIRITRKKCDACGECVDVCPASALFIYGKWMTAAEVLSAIEEDSVFYSRSGGGVTLSGGEPLLQVDFVADFLEKCKAHGLNTAIETCGSVPWNHFERIIPFIDHIFFDVKSADSDKHRVYTGRTNKQILRNLNQLCRQFPEKPVTIRTPVIGGLNDTPEDIANILKIIEPLPTIQDYELLPYHRFGSVKYDYLGMKYPMSDFKPLSPQLIAELRKIAEKWRPT